MTIELDQRNLQQQKIGQKIVQNVFNKFSFIKATLFSFLWSFSPTHPIGQLELFSRANLQRKILLKITKRERERERERERDWTKTIASKKSSIKFWAQSYEQPFRRNFKRHLFKQSWISVQYILPIREPLKQVHGLVYLVFGKPLYRPTTIFYSTVQIFFAVNGQWLKNNLFIWSHCLLGITTTWTVLFKTQQQQLNILMQTKSLLLIRNFY